MSELDILIADKPKITIPLPDERDKKMIEAVRQAFSDWRSWFETYYKERVRENFRRYNATVEAYEDVDDIWRGVDGHPIRLAIEYGVCETIKTKLLQDLLVSSNNQPIRIVPAKGTTVDNADKMNKVVYYFLNEDNFNEKLIAFVDQAVRNPGVPWAVYQRQNVEYYMETQTRSEPTVVYGQVTGERQVQEQVQKKRFTMNQPCLEIYDIESVGFNTAMGDYEDSPYKVIRLLLHRSKLAKMFPDFADYFNSGDLDWDGKDDYLQERQQEVSKSNQQNSSKKDGRIETYMWMEEERYTFVFGDKLIKEIPGPGREVPSGMLKILPSPFEVYGKDFITLSSQYADIWNEIINLDVDSTKIAGAVMTKVKAGTGTMLDTIYSAPNNMWIVENMDDVQEVVYNYQPGKALGLLEYIGRKDQVITGATDAATGVPVKADFAKDIERMTAQMNSRFWLANLNIKLELKKIFREFARHVQEYVAPDISPDHKLVFQILGEKGEFDQQEINNPQDLMGDFDYHFSFDPEDTNKGLVRAQLIQVITIVSKIPILAQFINPVQILQLVFKAFPNIKDLEKLVGDPGQQLFSILEKLDMNQLMKVAGLVDKLILANQQQMKSPQGQGGPQGPAGPSGAGVPRVPTQKPTMPAAGGPPVAGSRMF